MWNDCRKWGGKFYLKNNGSAQLGEPSFFLRKLLSLYNGVEINTSLNACRSFNSFPDQIFCLYLPYLLTFLWSLHDRLCRFVCLMSTAFLGVLLALSTPRAQGNMFSFLFILTRRLLNEFPHYGLGMTKLLQEASSSIFLYESASLHAASVT